MATVNPYGIERRRIPDRRSGVKHLSTNRTLTAIDWVAMTLLIVGGVNWGLVGLFNLDLVAELFGVMTPLSRLVYILVGLSALYTIYTATKMAGRSS